MNKTHNPPSLRFSIDGSIGFVVLVAICSGSAFGQSPPNDANQACIVAPTEFPQWFRSGTVQLNGAVKPADSINFPDAPNCSFYQWSEQMFLWLTSPKGAGRVLDSDIFFEVSGADATGKRTLRQLGGPDPHFQMVAFRDAQVGSKGLPVAFDAAGKLRNVVRAKRSDLNKVLFKDAGGKFQESESIQFSTVQGKTLTKFLDKAGKEIAADDGRQGLPTLQTTTGAPLEIASVSQSVDGNTFFMDSAGNLVDIGFGQAQGASATALDGVLMAQNGSLVYYSIAVNNVFASMARGNNQVPPAFSPAFENFPVTEAELRKIEVFNGSVFIDREALAVEIKAAWVETTGLNVANYITTKATIPTFDTTDPKKWLVNGTKATTLALVGLHVVGSTKGHPELIWATFEHQSNAPNGAYAYNTPTGRKLVSQTPAGPGWLFCDPAADMPFNISSRIRVAPSGSPSGIQARPLPVGTTIGASNVMRPSAWGSKAAVNPNPLVDDAGSNTEIISINNSVHGQLISGDVRRNYNFIGATWTIGGAAPKGPFPPTPLTPDANEVGTSRLANMTMETFHSSFNCFQCHTGSPGGNPGLSPLSHIFTAIKP